MATNFDHFKIFDQVCLDWMAGSVSMSLYTGRYTMRLMIDLRARLSEIGPWGQSQMSGLRG